MRLSARIARHSVVEGLPERLDHWRARAGHVALAEAIVLTFEDRPDEADAAFHRAQASFQRYRLPLDEADLLHCWGLVHSPAPEPDRPPPSSSTPHSPSCAGMAPAHHGSTE